MDGQDGGDRWAEAPSSQRDGGARLQEGHSGKGTFRRWQGLGKDVGGMVKKAD